MGVDCKEDRGVGHTDVQTATNRQRPPATCWVTSNSGSASSVSRGGVAGVQGGGQGVDGQTEARYWGVYLMPGQSVSVPDTAARLGVAPSRGFTLALMQGAICGSELLGDDGDAFIS